MNCGCLKEIEIKVMESLQKKSSYKKPVKKVRLLGTVMAISNNTLHIRSCNQAEIELVGQKKLELTNIVHRFCPFCGINQEDQS